MLKDKLKLILSILLASALVCGFISCSNSSDSDNGNTELQKKILELKGVWVDSYGSEYEIKVSENYNISAPDINKDSYSPYITTETVSDFFSKYGDRNCLYYNDNNGRYAIKTLREAVTKLINIANSFGYRFSKDDICAECVGFGSQMYIFYMEEGKLYKLVIHCSKESWSYLNGKEEYCDFALEDYYSEYDSIPYFEESDYGFSVTSYVRKPVNNDDDNNDGSSGDSGSGTGSSSGSFSGTLSGTYTLQEATASSKTSTFEFCSDGTLKKSVGAVVTELTYTQSGSTLSVTIRAGQTYEFTLEGSESSITVKGDTVGIAQVFGVTNATSVTLTK